MSNENDELLHILYREFNTTLLSLGIWPQDALLHRSHYTSQEERVQLHTLFLKFVKQFGKC